MPRVGGADHGLPRRPALAGRPTPVREACHTYMEQFRQTIRALGRLPEESLSSTARDALLVAFRSWSRG